MKTKSAFLLLIFLLSLIPVYSVQAEQEIAKSLSDSFALLYVSDAILLNEIVDDETSSNSKVSSRTLTGYLPDETTDLINQMINATKAQRNDHDQKCRETIEIYRQQGKTCEVDQTNAYCKSKRAEFTAKIAALRKKRGGDRRKWFTKQWHGVKRAGAKFWHRIGPLGRKFLSELGPQALKIVLAGGPGTEALLKNLIKHTVKNMARQRFKQIGFQALQRILKVQIEVAAAAGVDICDSEEDQTQTEPDQANTDEIQSSGLSSIPDGARWKCEDISGILTMLKSMEGPDMTIQKHELDFWLVYNKSGPTVHAYFYYQSVENWENGVMTRTASAEDKSIPIDEFGVFRVRFEIDRTVTAGGTVDKVHYAENFYGLISPQNYEKAYVCDVFDIELPSGLHTLSPENFQERCGWNHYYECSLTTQ
jgi:hypothetical protein